MTEWKLFDGEIPYISTPEYHAQASRAPHLDEPVQQARMYKAAEFLMYAAQHAGPEPTWSDLGCGDGGMLSLAQGSFTEAWGYDLLPANAEGFPERGVQGEIADILSPGADRSQVRTGSVVSLTEVLEHLADPHGVLRWLRGLPHVRWIVASSPAEEDDMVHCEEHAWAWDTAGYAALFAGAGWRLERQVLVDSSQVVLAEPEARDD
jgi:methyltransferase family protein